MMPFRTPSRFVAVLPIIILIGSACDRSGLTGNVSLVEETLPNGATLLRYGPLPTEPTAVVEPDLVIGVVSGEPWEMFGSIRGIEAAPDGTIWILDAQARELRAFASDGRFLDVVAGPGEGPGEITQTNGFVRDGDGNLWINDWGKRRIVGIRPDGTEFARVPLIVPGYGFIWYGAIDREGQLLEPWSTSVGPPVFPPTAGLNESESNYWIRTLDPRTEVVDSVRVGRGSGRWWVIEISGGWQSRQIPFDARPTFAIDPEGGSWKNAAGPYRLIRFDAAGDTTLVVEVANPRLPVVPEDRDELIRSMTEPNPDLGPTARAIAAAMPTERPATDEIAVDDEGRIWVRRGRFDDDPVLRDVFSRDGRWLGTIEIDLGDLVPDPWLPPRIRSGHLYMVARDEFEVERVVRVPLPPLDP